MNGSGPTWHVVSQSETSGQLPDGTFGPGVKVSFSLSDGTAGSVFIGKAAYTKDAVMTAIKEQVGKMVEIQQLSGSVE